jgi:hypothetical protein
VSADVSRIRKIRKINQIHWGSVAAVGQG